MSAEFLPLTCGSSWDNSGVGIQPSAACAINCKNLIEAVAGYVRNSLSDNTKRAYLADLAHFESWGGAIPAVPETVAAYIAAHADKLSPATLDRRLAAISKAHKARSQANPTRSALVHAVLRGIKREKGVAQKQAAPLLKRQLAGIVAAMSDTPKGFRDRALLLLGFAGAFRRSELAGLEREDLEFTREGLIVHLRRSKTDQLGRGRKVGIRRDEPTLCPVAALERWLSVATIKNGAVFLRVDCHDNILPTPISGEAVSMIVKERVAAVGLNPNAYSGHSLRAGFATSAALAGIPSWRIRQQTGHASETMLAHYIRDADVFNAC